MKNIISFLFILPILISCNTINTTDISYSYSIPNNNYWRDIATAMQIIVVNSSELKAEDITPNRNYEFNIHVVKTLKGIEQENIRFKIFMKKENINYLNSLNYNGSAIIFLLSAYDGYGYNNYLANYIIGGAIIEYTKEIEIILKEEILLQTDIINNKLYENFNIDKKLYSRIKGYVNRVSSIFFQFDSFRNLEKIEKIGVPYIILALNNFKKLPIKYIKLENKSVNAFEKYRQYGPELVIDALAAILNQITGEDFGAIENGEATKEMRISVLNGWRIYLYKLINNHLKK